MAESVNLLLPKVGRLGADRQLKQDIPEDIPCIQKPRKKGQISRGRAKKKNKTLNRYDAVSDHNHLDKKKKSEKDLTVGFPKVAVCAVSAFDKQDGGEEDEQEDNSLTLPQILMERTNIWGRRHVVKKRISKEKVQLEIEGTDLPHPPPKPVTIPRNKQKEFMQNEGENFDDVLGEVADIRKILHCHIVGMPVEIKKHEHDDTQVARPLFHCQDCLDYWLENSEIKEDCKEPQKPVRGPRIVITDETAQLIKSVWKRRAEAEAAKKEAKKQRKREKKMKRRQQQQIDSSNVDHIMQDMVQDPDDYNVVLQHIAEGIARNAGFNENIMNSASAEITKHLSNLLGGNKPDDPAVMEVIEKFLGETELMILRSMVDVNKSTGSSHKVADENASMLLDRLAVLKTIETKDMKTEKVTYLSKIYKLHDKKTIEYTPMPARRQNTQDIDVHASQESLSNITSEQDGHSYTSKQSTSSQRYQQKKPAAYNRKVIRTGYDDPTLVGDVKVDNSEKYYQRNESDESDSEGKDNYTSSFYSYATSDDEDRSVDDASTSSHATTTTAGSTKEKYVLPTKPRTTDEGRRPLAKKHAKVAPTKSEASSLNSQISSTSRHGKKKHTPRSRKTHHKKHGTIQRSEDNSDGGHITGKHSHRGKKSSHKVKTKKPEKKHEKQTEEFTQSTSTRQDDTRYSNQKDKNKNKQQLQEQLPQKNQYEQQQQHTMGDKLGGYFDKLTIKDYEFNYDDDYDVDPSTASHLVYDVDDTDDYSSDENDFATVDVDDDGAFVIPGNEGYTDSAYDTLVDELVQHYENTSNFQGEKVDLDQMKQAMQRGVVQKTGLANYYKTTTSPPPFEANISTEQLIKTSTDTKKTATGYILKDQYQNQPVVDPKKQQVDSTARPLKQRKKKERVEGDKHKKKPDFYDKFKRAEKKQPKDDTGSVDNAIDATLDMQDMAVTSTDELKSPMPSNMNSQSRSVQKEKPRTTASNTLNSSDRDLDQGGLGLGTPSRQAAQPSAKHVAIGETHFGMQLDALASLPPVPNPLDVGLRRRSITTPGRGVKVLGPKQDIRGHHSRQIENSNMDILKGPTRLEQASSMMQTMDAEQDVQTAPTPTQVEKTRTRRSSLQFSLTRKDAPSRTLIGGDQSIATRPQSGFRKIGGKRPTSSKNVLPPIHKDQDHSVAELPENHEVVYRNGKPVAEVRPMPAACNGSRIKESASQTGSMTSGGRDSRSAYDYEAGEPISKHIILPSSEAISILSFTSSFSFSMFNMPSQYQQQNETVKNYNNLVGKTKPKEFSREVLNKIPTKERLKKSGAPVKNVVVARNKVVVGNLNKKVQKKIADPKPIARYVKKYLAPVTELTEEDTATKQAEQLEADDTNEVEQEGMTVPGEGEGGSQHSKISVHFDIDTREDQDEEEYMDSNEDNDKHQQHQDGNSRHHQQREGVEYISVPDPQGGPDRMLSVYASVQLESQMHLNDAESVIIRVQEYS